MPRTRAAASDPKLKEQLKSLGDAYPNLCVKLKKHYPDGGEPVMVQTWESVASDFVLKIEEEAKRLGGPGSYTCELYALKDGQDTPEFVRKFRFAIPSDPTSATREEDMAKQDTRPQWNPPPAWGGYNAYGSGYGGGYGYPMPVYQPIYTPPQQPAAPPQPPGPDPATQAMITELREANKDAARRADAVQAELANLRVQHANDAARVERDRDRADADRKIEDARREANDRARVLEDALKVNQRELTDAIKALKDERPKDSAASAAAWAPVVASLATTLAGPMIASITDARAKGDTERNQLRQQAEQNFRDLMAKSIDGFKDRQDLILQLARTPGQEKVSDLVGAFANVMSTTLDSMMAMARASSGDQAPPWLPVAQSVISGLTSMANSALMSRATSGAAQLPAGGNGAAAPAGAPAGSPVAPASVAAFASGPFGGIARKVHAILSTSAVTAEQLAEAASWVVEWADTAYRTETADPVVHTFWSDPAGTTERIVNAVLGDNPARFDIATKLIEAVRAILRDMAKQGDQRVPAAFIASNGAGGATTPST